MGRHFDRCPACDETSFGRRFSIQQGGLEAGFSCCRSCRLLWVDPQPGGEDLRDLYDEQYFRDRSYERKAAYRLRIAGRRLRVLERHLGGQVEGRRLVEVGCAMGYGLTVARTMGFHVSGVEINRFAAQRGREAFGLDIFAGDLESSPIRSGSVDVIAGWDLLEHLPDPGLFLDTARNLLGPNGLLVLHTPVTDAPGFRILGPRWRHLKPPEHLFHFTRDNLGILAGRHGFTSRRKPPSLLALTDFLFRDSYTAFLQKP